MRPRVRDAAGQPDEPDADRVGQRTLRRNIQRLGRDLDRPGACARARHHRSRVPRAREQTYVGCPSHGADRRDLSLVADGVGVASPPNATS